MSSLAPRPPFESRLRGGRPTHPYSTRQREDSSCPRPGFPPALGWPGRWLRREGGALPARQPPEPLNAYGRWKLLAKQAVRAACPDAVILRLPLLYGPAQFAAETNLTEASAAVRHLGADPARLDAAVKALSDPTSNIPVSHILHGAPPQAPG
ncbi:sugar nucleotide-binding protein [Streptomyces sp. NPDC058409]|uniref:sugar nucleotide-binding protein n=1 Tax=Streptomyces sp. NPDC058409 TaxID=3346484 RepID=UPI00366229F2